MGWNDREWQGVKRMGGSEGGKTGMVEVSARDGRVLRLATEKEMTEKELVGGADSKGKHDTRWQGRKKEAGDDVGSMDPWGER